MSQFRIQEKISESGSTAVYRAFQEALERPVLLKVLHQHLSKDAVVSGRFSREAKACAHLRSDYIVQVYDLTEYNGCPAIVMEYVHGRSLKDVIEEPGIEREQLAMKTAVSMLKALSTAHRHGIVHRDVKPGNILVSDEGKIKLTDFGLAHVADSPVVTLEGTVLGTPAYMAPEQVRGETVDARTDFFSLGVTLVEVLTGDRIFKGSTYSECVKKIMDFRTDHLDQMMKAIPAERLAFLKRLMDPDPNLRYQSAAEALKDLGESEEAEKAASRTVWKSGKVLVPVLSFIGVAAIVLWLMDFSGPKTDAVVPAGAPVQSQVRSDSTANLTVEQGGIKLPVDTDTKAKTPGAAQTVKPGKGSAAQPIVSTMDSANVVFTSNPWAKVYVDGRLVGETPLGNPVSLARGKHSVTFTNPTFDPIVMNVNIQPGKDQVVSANFIKHAGYLMCTVQPWAEVYVDEQYKDTTPLSKPIILSAGVHRLRFHNSALRDSLQVVTIQPGDTVAVTITLRRPQ